MSMQQKQSVLSMKDKETIISHLEKGEKGTNLALEFNISKQQISDIRKNKEKILKFTDSVEMSKGLEIHKYLQSVTIGHLNMSFLYDRIYRYIH